MALWIMVILMGQNTAFAELFINEIMYDLPDSDDGKEWVEVYNVGPESVDFTEYKFFEADTNHKLLLAQGSPKIETLGYAIIVSNFEKFKTSNPYFAGNVFDSSFSLSNTGEKLAIVDKDLKIIDEFIYSSSMGGAGNGKSLQKINGVWLASKPTLGAENIFVAPPPSTPVAPKPVTIPKEVPTSGRVGIPTENVGEKIDEPPKQPLGGEAQASAGLANFKGTENNMLPIIAFAILLTVSAVSVYFIRRSRGKNQLAQNSAEEFEILE